MSPTRISANRAPDALGQRRERSPTLGETMDSAPEAHNALSVLRNETDHVRHCPITLRAERNELLRHGDSTSRRLRGPSDQHPDGAPSGAAPRTRRLRLLIQGLAWELY